MRTTGTAFLFVLCLAALVCGAVGVKGVQDYWSLAPQDVRVGEIMFSTKALTDCSKDSFTFTANSVWGDFTYKVTRLEETPMQNPIRPPSAGKKRVSCRAITFSEVGTLNKEQTLLLSGTILRVEEGGRRLVGLFPFGALDVQARLDLIDSKPGGIKPPPTIRNIPYGRHWRQTIDFYKAESDTPTPLVVMIHGGGWSALDKGNGTWGVHGRLLKAGISFASINYRLIPDTVEDDVKPPVKACLEDAARAIQMLRYKANELNIDKARIGAFGGSAGACSSMWLALHDDMADPASDDPVTRESTRLQCAAGVGAQTSLDPHQMREWMPNIAYGGHAFGFRKHGRSRAEEFEEFHRSRDQVLPWIKEYSPYEHAGADDPPIFLDYPKQTQPPEPGTQQADPTHSAIFGVKLVEKLSSLGVEAYVSYPGHTHPTYRSVADFFLHKLGAKPEQGK